MEKDNMYIQNPLAIETANYDILDKNEFDEFLLTLPEVLDKEMVKRLLLELPTQLFDITNKALVFKKLLGDAKITLKTKKMLLEHQKAEVRNNEIDEYTEKVKQFQKKSEEIMKMALQSKEIASIKKMYAQEMLKVHMPQKPTRADLDDIANVKTYHLQQEIDLLEEKIKDYSLELDVVNSKKEFYDNVWITVRAYKGIVVEEMRSLGENG